MCSIVIVKKNPKNLIIFTDKRTTIVWDDKPNRETPYSYTAGGKSIIKPACVAQCQPEDFHPEESEQNHNPSADFSIPEERWLRCGEVIRAHLQILPQHPLMTLLCSIRKPQEEDIPQIPPLCEAALEPQKRIWALPIRTFAYQKENCCQCSSKETLACGDVTKHEAANQTEAALFDRYWIASIERHNNDFVTYLKPDFRLDSDAKNASKWTV